MMSLVLEDSYNKLLLWALNNSATVLNQLQRMFIVVYALLLQIWFIKNSGFKQEKIKAQQEQVKAFDTL